MNPSTLRLDAMHTDLSENLEISDDECDLGEQTLSVNTVNVHLEISSVYRASLEKDSVPEDQKLYHPKCRQCQ
jgi:hypothetical protein